MDDFEWKYKDLTAFLRYNAENLSFMIDAHNVNDIQGIFILFYRWIIRDSTFLAITKDQQTFERVNIEAFQTLFMEHNPDWERYMPPYEALSAFFWQVCRSGFTKHFDYVEKRYPELFNKKSN